MDELILKERETKEKIVELINNSNLPAVMIRPILEEMLRQISIVEEKQYEQALKSKEQKKDKKKGSE